jgi:hypothetical protein
MQLTPDQEAQKKAIFDRMSPRRRKHVQEKYGYEAWNPFEMPNDPIDIRRGPTGRTLDQLIREFLQLHPEQRLSTHYNNGVQQAAMGIMSGDERIRGIYDFSVWYHELLQKEAEKGRQP